DVKEKIEAGERFDVVIGNPPIIDGLIKQGAVIGPRADIGRSGSAWRCVRARQNRTLQQWTPSSAPYLQQRRSPFPVKAPAGSILLAFSIAWGSRERCKASSSRWKRRTRWRLSGVAKPTWSWWSQRAFRTFRASSSLDRFPKSCKRRSVLPPVWLHPRKSRKPPRL